MEKHPCLVIGGLKTTKLINYTLASVTMCSVTEGANEDKRGTSCTFGYLEKVTSRDDEVCGGIDGGMVASRNNKLGTEADISHSAWVCCI
jgi:hypothetical protein